MSVQRRQWTRADGKRAVAWRVRWCEGDRWRSRTFTNKADADTWDRHIKDHQRLGTVERADAGKQTLDQFVRDTFTPTYVTALAPKTAAVYAALYDRHISPELGSVQLRQISPENIRRWQAARLNGGAGPATIHK